MPNSLTNTMTADLTFTVTLIKPSEGIPVIERGAYRYTGEWLPKVGDTISVTPGDASNGGAQHPILGYVTRVDPFSENPISVVEADAVAPTDDLLAETEEP
jgi:hypothetical protein